MSIIKELRFSPSRTRLQENCQDGSNKDDHAIDEKTDHELSRTQKHALGQHTARIQVDKLPSLWELYVIEGFAQ
ncbi:MAG: hypothetical protein AAF311_04740 [Pseudomonadota bacterium]